MHKTNKPAGQPRTVRTRAEELNSSGGFADAVIPDDDVNPAVYVDTAERARPTASRGLTAADPRPFVTRGRG